MLPQQTSHRIYLNHIDKLRGFAACWVLLFHVSTLTKWYSSSHYFGVFMGMGSLGVDFFFVISGLVIYLSAHHLSISFPQQWPKKYLIHRMYRLFPLYLFSCIIFMVFIQPEWMNNAIRFIMHQLVTHFFMIHNWFTSTHGSINGVTWTIAVEFQFYLLVFILFYFKIKMKLALLAMILGAIFYRLMISLFADASDTNTMFFYITQLIGVLDEFALGMLLAWLLTQKKLKQKISLISWIVLALFTIFICGSTLFFYWQNLWRVWSNPFMLIIGRFFYGVSAALLCWLFLSTPKFPRILDVILDFPGKISYGIYLWHLPVILCLQKAGASADLSFLLKTLCWTFLLSTLSYFIIEKVWIDKGKNMGNPEPLKNYN